MKKLLFLMLSAVVISACGKSKESPYFDFIGAKLKDSNFEHPYTVTFQSKTPEGFILYCDHELSAFPGEVFNATIEYTHAKKKKDTMLIIKSGSSLVKYYKITVTSDKITHDEGELVRVN